MQNRNRNYGKVALTGHREGTGQSGVYLYLEQNEFTNLLPALLTVTPSRYQLLSYQGDCKSLFQNLYLHNHQLLVQTMMKLCTGTKEPIG